MSTIPARYHDLLLVAADELKNLLWSDREQDVKLVQKGLLIYRQGLVGSVRFDEDMVTAMVQNVTKVQVELHLNFLMTSTCSCPQEGFCRHQLAAFFHVYAQMASVTEWVESWRQPLQEKKSAQNWGVQRAKDLLKSTTPMKPDYDRWVRSFQVSFQAMMYAQKNLKPYLVDDLFQVYTRRLKAGAPVEQEWRQLYYLVASVHSFQMLLKLGTDFHFTEREISRYYRETFYTLIDEVDDFIHKLHIQALPFAFDDFIEKLKRDTFHLIAEPFNLEFEPIYLYRILWSGLFKKKAWHEEELNKFIQKYPTNQTFAVIVAAIHQYYLLKNDDEAIRLIKVLKENATPYMIYWLEQLTSSKEWKRLNRYVEEFAAHIHPYIQELPDTYARMDFTRMALSTIQPYIIETEKFDLYEKVLVQGLPYSFNAYEMFLFEQGWYEKWADLQTYIGYDVGSIPTDRIKFLQKEKPEVLLPLYHHSIQRHINLKNRGNYREAVKLLKKLRTLYKKLKKQDDFQQFMDHLLDKTKRLRAFHEECERGKLTHA